MRRVLCASETLILLLVALLLPTYVGADIVYFKDGGAVEGVVLEQDSSHVSIKREIGMLKVRSEFVERVVYGDVEIDSTVAHSIMAMQTYDLPAENLLMGFCLGAISFDYRFSYDAAAMYGAQFAGPLYEYLGFKMLVGYSRTEVTLPHPFGGRFPANPWFFQANLVLKAFKGRTVMTFLDGGAGGFFHEFPPVHGPRASYNIGLGLDIQAGDRRRLLFDIRGIMVPEDILYYYSYSSYEIKREITYSFLVSLGYAFEFRALK